MLVISGTRPVRRTEGRAYQQVEIPTGSFRRAVELGVDVDAEAARATFEDGLLRIELPIRMPEASARTVPVERSSG
jgi:HSP20 family protein